MLVRWCPDVVSISVVLQFAVIVGVEVVILGAQQTTFGMPVAFALAPLGAIERSRGTWEDKQGDFGVQA